MVFRGKCIRNRTNSQTAIFTLTLIKDNNYFLWIYPLRILHKPCSLGYQSLAVPIRHQFHHPSHLVSLHQDLECVEAYPSPYEEKDKNKSKRQCSSKTKADIFPITKALEGMMVL